MAYIPVVSSNIDGVQYNNAEEALSITFKSGATYTYFEVPEDVFIDLLEADSVGVYFNQYIKNNYQWSQD